MLLAKVILTSECSRILVNEELHFNQIMNKQEADIYRYDIHTM